MRDTCRVDKRPRGLFPWYVEAESLQRPGVNMMGTAAESEPSIAISCEACTCTAPVVSGPSEKTVHRFAFWDSSGPAAKRTNQSTNRSDIV